MSIKIVIDSASDISKEEAEKLGVELIPMQIFFGEEEYLDGLNLFPNEFYDKLVTMKDLPKTSQINPYRFEEVFERLVKEGNEVIAIILSSKLSNTYNCAVQASEKFDGKVYVVDTLSAAAGERILCEYALKLINEGNSAKEIADELNNVKNKINIIAAVDTLLYLKKGGRISSTVAFAGKLFNVKPILSVIDGEVKMIDKVRGQKKAAMRITSIAKERGGINYDLPFCAIYSGNDDSMIQNYIANSELFVEKNVRYYILGSTIGTHVGPGVIGLVYFSK